MICYRCGCTLSEHDFCTNCGADVTLYKRIIYISNRFYNDGLERAGVRDLTGAITSLRQSLKFDKNNVEARNLLGLVYFETGEVVAALSEWVISTYAPVQVRVCHLFMVFGGTRAGVRCGVRRVLVSGIRERWRRQAVCRAPSPTSIAHRAIVC